MPRRERTLPHRRCQLMWLSLSLPSCRSHCTCFVFTCLRVVSVGTHARYSHELTRIPGHPIPSGLVTFFLLFWVPLSSMFVYCLAEVRCAGRLLLFTECVPSLTCVFCHCSADVSLFFLVRLCVVGAEFTRCGLSKRTPARRS